MFISRERRSYRDRMRENREGERQKERIRKGKIEGQSKRDRYPNLLKCHP